MVPDLDALLKLPCGRSTLRRDGRFVAAAVRVDRERVVSGSLDCYQDRPKNLFLVRSQCGNSFNECWAHKVFVFVARDCDIPATFLLMRPTTPCFAAGR